MPLDVSTVGTSGPRVRLEWNPQDVIVYALGVGAGQVDPSAELQFTTENSQDVQLQVLPTFGVTRAMSTARRPPFGSIEQAQILHGEQVVRVERPLAPSGAADVETTITGIYDQGKFAFVVSETTITDAESGVRLGSGINTVVVRGEGGFGGQRRESDDWHRPGEPAGLRLTAGVRPDQALLYRLSGDDNPLHSDPAFAARAGFDRPILHGMWTLGTSGRLLINALADGNPELVRELRGRFVKPVLPGGRLTVEVWPGSPTSRFVVRDETGDVVLDRGHVLVAPVADQAAPADDPTCGA